MKDFSIFDIVGPNMIGPSSSHTAGACKLGKIAHRLIKGDVKQVVFYLHGSFAKTYRGHGTDKALLGGILGYNEDDENIKHSFVIAADRGIKFSFQEIDLGEVHPNTVKIEMENHAGEKLTILGSSIGGGNIVITEIDGVQLEFTGEYPTLIISHTDKPGIIAKVTAILSLYNINIAYMRVYRYNRGKNAFMIIETDNEIDVEALRHIKNVEHIANAYLVSIN